MTTQSAEDRVVFPSLNAALAFARLHWVMFYAKIAGQEGMLQIYPGGRTIKWPEHSRFLNRCLTHRDRERIERNHPQFRRPQ